MNRGFTLTEMLVVVSIISILIIASVVGGIRLYERSQAQRIAQDFRDIETAWNAWRADTHLEFPRQLDYPTSAGCPGFNVQTRLQDTNLYDNLNDSSGDYHSTLWNGPYLSKLPFEDQWGNEYLYDNDPSIYVEGSCNVNDINDGVNIIVIWCTSQQGNYWRLRNHLDEIIDNGDGQCNGKFRSVDSGFGWGNFAYLLDPRGTP